MASSRMSFLLVPHTVFPLRSWRRMLCRGQRSRIYTIYHMRVIIVSYSSINYITMILIPS